MALSNKRKTIIKQYKGVKLCICSTCLWSSWSFFNTPFENQHQEVSESVRKWETLLLPLQCVMKLYHHAVGKKATDTVQVTLWYCHYTGRCVNVIPIHLEHHINVECFIHTGETGIQVTTIHLCDRRKSCIPLHLKDVFKAKITLYLFTALWIVFVTKWDLFVSHTATCVSSFKIKHPEIDKLTARAKWKKWKMKHPHAPNIYKSPVLYYLRLLKWKQRYNDISVLQVLHLNSHTHPAGKWHYMTLLDCWCSCINV